MADLDQDEEQRSLSAPASPFPRPMEEVVADNGTQETTKDDDDDNVTISRTQSLLRQAIKEIHGNPNLSAAEKSRRVQDLMNTKPSKKTCEPSKDNSQAPDECDLLATYFTLKDGGKVFGCEHYQTNCKVLAECCKRWYPCRFCHDEWTEKNSDLHLINRKAIKMMLCQYCHLVSPASGVCQCGQSMAKYYCEKCKLFDNDPDKDIFHCEECGICRLGKRENFIHCKTCNGCIERSYYMSHKCLDGCLDANCPICGDHLFISIMPVMFMRCGHAIHSLCFNLHSRESYRCPVCQKSVGDMSAWFKYIDDALVGTQMPEQYANIRAEILCNDCERRSVAKYHFIYHKCLHCGGYNTKLIRSFSSDQEDTVFHPMTVREGDIAGIEQVVPRPGAMTPPSLGDIEEEVNENEHAATRET